MEGVVARFATLCGMEEAEALAYTALCEDAWQSVLAMVREDIVIELYRHPLEYGAAALAVYRYAVSKDATEEGNLAVGEFHYKGKSRVEAAKALWHEAKGHLAPLLRETGFYFGRTNLGV